MVLGGRGQRLMQCTTSIAVLPVLIAKKNHLARSAHGASAVTGHLGERENVSCPFSRGDQKWRGNLEETSGLENYLRTSWRFSVASHRGSTAVRRAWIFFKREVFLEPGTECFLVSLHKRAHRREAARACSHSGRGRSFDFYFLSRRCWGVDHRARRRQWVTLMGNLPRASESAARWTPEVPRPWAGARPPPVYPRVLHRGLWVPSRSLRPAGRDAGVEGPRIPPTGRWQSVRPSPEDSEGFVRLQASQSPSEAIRSFGQARKLLSFLRQPPVPGPIRPTAGRNRPHISGQCQVPGVFGPESGLRGCSGPPQLSQGQAPSISSTVDFTSSQGGPPLLAAGWVWADSSNAVPGKAGALLTSWRLRTELLAPCPGLKRCWY